jgi:hypothetical protein
MGRMVMDFSGMGFVGHGRRFGDMKITYKILSEILNAVCSCRLKEKYYNLP